MRTCCLKDTAETRPPSHPRHRPPARRPAVQASRARVKRGGGKVWKEIIMKQMSSMSTSKAGPTHPWEDLLIPGRETVPVAGQRVDSGPTPRGDRSQLQVCKTSLGPAAHGSYLAHCCWCTKGPVEYVEILLKQCSVSPHSLIESFHEDLLGFSRGSGSGTSPQRTQLADVTTIMRCWAKVAADRHGAETRPHGGCSDRKRLRAGGHGHQGLRLLWGGQAAGPGGGDGRGGGETRVPGQGKG